MDESTVITAAMGARIVLDRAAHTETLPKCDSVIGDETNHAAMLEENAVVSDRAMKL